MHKTPSKLTELFSKARRVALTPESKFVFFSDIHRGTDDWADDFSRNSSIFYHALRWYYEQGFSYFELGDGDELWKNTDFALIRRSHGHVFDLLKSFHKEQRLHLLFGNHDLERQKKSIVKSQLFHYHSQHLDKKVPLLPGIQVHEALVLEYRDKFPILLVHGHQGDLFADTLWQTSRFLTRYVWKRFQMLGMKDPISAAANHKIRHRIEIKFRNWIENNQIPIICGHTHRSFLPKPGDTPYFNTGSAVHPRCITGIEIENDRVSLVKWLVMPDEIGALRIKKELLEGPWPLCAYFEGIETSKEIPCPTPLGQ